MAMAEDAAGGIGFAIGVGWAGDFDQLGGGCWELVAAREIVAQQGLDVAVREKAARAKGFGDELGHQEAAPATCSKKAAAFKAPVGSSSCRK